MNVLVLLRLTPDPASEFEILQDGSGIDYEWVDYKLNDFDDHALEEAILLKESCGARVSVVGTGEGAVRALQMAAARGADDVFLLEYDGESFLSSRRLAANLAVWAREHDVDLILGGVQAGEDLFGQFVPFVGAALDWPHISGSSGLSLSGDNLSVAVEIGGGAVANYGMPLPAVVGVQTASRAPRYVTGNMLKEAMKVLIGMVDPIDDIVHPDVEIASVTLPPQASAEILGEDADDAAGKVARILADVGLIAGKPT